MSIDDNIDKWPTTVDKLYAAGFLVENIAKFYLGFDSGIDFFSDFSIDVGQRFKDDFLYRTMVCEFFVGYAVVFGTLPFTIKNIVKNREVAKAKARDAMYKIAKYANYLPRF